MSETYDISGKIGSLYASTEPPEWPMYSYERPSWMIWNAIAAVLHDEMGWSDNKIREWLASKETRWALDNDLGDVLREAAATWARTSIGGPNE